MAAADVTTRRPRDERLRTRREAPSAAISEEGAPDKAEQISTAATTSGRPLVRGPLLATLRARPNLPEERESSGRRRSVTTARQWSRPGRTAAVFAGRLDAGPTPLRDPLGDRPPAARGSMAGCGAAPGLLTRLLLMLLVVSQVTSLKNSSLIGGTSVASVQSVQSVVYAAAVSNLSVVAELLHAGSRTLQLRVAWRLPSEGRRPSRLVLTVVRADYPGCPLEPDYCPDGFVYEVIEDTDRTNMAVPRHPLRDPFKIVPECCYEVKMESSPHDGRTFAAVNFSAPECVRDVCSCRVNRLPAPNVTSVSAVGADTVKVTWTVDPVERGGEGEALANISRFRVRLGEEVLRSSSGLAVFNTSARAAVPGAAAGGGAALLGAALRGDRRYQAEVWAEDARRCRGRSGSLVFAGGSLVHSSELKYNIWALPVVLAICVLAAALCLAAWLTSRRCVRRAELRLRPPDAYKPVSVNSDIPRFSDVIKSALHERNILYVEAEIEDARRRGAADCFEVSPGCLQLLHEVGKGAFGQVFLAQAECLGGVPGRLAVAVKTLRPQASDEESEEFLAEIAMMKRVGRHPNVVAMLGCCTLAAPYFMVMEFVPCGDLLRYLHALRAKYQRRVAAGPKYLQLMLTPSDSGASYIFPGESSCDSSESVFISPDTTDSGASAPSGTLASAADEAPVRAGPRGRSSVLDSAELQDFALQVARGMEYLEDRQITHRDLAARNVLIDERKTLKISDFGLSRRGVYVTAGHKKVPLRWMSVEAIRDNQYSSRSDVWAFAVLLWEIGTLGAFPYATVGDYRLLPFLLEGKRLEKPDNCTKELYALMLQCWAHSADDRPQFASVVASLEAMSASRRAYVNFDQLLEGHSFPPTEEELKSR
ncbi:uncharacterized protein LOC134536479 [Bacillus rossius redtenbacheri]|uniref:uncharacterized protein LOC134536479 n=1 Tax=Bacillus rossius redtenbacheri TaxID=93214 RepID=UPI002FDDA9C2